ncbi:PREDICTED: uncharacterized protein LOC108618081 [Drosophila arizonae]|uniref:Uncharacterized protein LOC108618081 n=1 Tax=Drosophila arizonae TaxID=7263 RepID=A0ABM1PQJ1_DROAR|nr:PREDICTED: uncharacterized protein LOC108618081 [Drosophila arizonae]
MSPDYCWPFAWLRLFGQGPQLGISLFWPTGSCSWHRIEMELKGLFILCSLQMLAVSAEPGYEHSNRNAELESPDSILDVEAAESVEHGATGKQLRVAGKSSARYADYDYYTTGRRTMDTVPGENDLSGAAAIRTPGRDQSLGYVRKPEDERMANPLPWYGQYTGKSIAMYPSRSYDPYIRRYDRFDEQYHRAYPPYYEDMYVHRQRFDPYDSYSPRVPQYPEPYLMYPDRHLDTPPPTDYIKSRRGYIDDPMAMAMPVLDSYSNKYVSPKLPQQLSSPRNRNERVVYYAHLPEIVRTPYDMPVTRKDRNAATAAAAALVAQPAAFKPNKKKLKTLQRSDNSTNYKQIF